MKGTFQSTLHFLTRRARLSVLRNLVWHWRFWNSDLIAESYLADIFPGIEAKPLRVTAGVRHHFELPYGERLVLAGILEHLRPKRIFEFGTYSGSTTALIADLCGDACQIFTLDLPDETLKAAGIAPSEIGRWFAGKPAYQPRITQLKGNSRAFDFSPYYGTFDLVFVDGSHKYDDVLSDSRHALRMLRHGGYILWDDYHATCLPVAEALDELARGIPIARIAQTRLAISGPHNYSPKL